MRIGWPGSRQATAVVLVWLGAAAFADDGDPLLITDGIPRVSTPAAEVIVQSLRTDLVAIIVDGTESAVIKVYRSNGRFFVPAAVLGKLGIRVERDGEGLVLDTPGGRTATDSSYFYRIGDETYFHTDLLDDALKVQWRFLPERYALDFALPWWRQSEQRVAASPTDSAAVDFEPSSFGLTQVRFDHTQFRNDGDSSYGNELLLRGRLADGIWRGEVYHVEDRDPRAVDYYWLRDFEHVQALVGNQQVQINPVLPGLETTGVQALYNSEPFEFDPHMDQTRNQYIRRLGIPTREIEGLAQAGAIAELRVDDRPVARVRVRLDGTYRFRGITLPALQFVQVEVHILDQRSLIVLEVQDFTQTPIDLLLKRGQSVAFGGAGVNGNPLDPYRDVRDEAVYGLWRYGLTDRLTLEAGLQSVSGRAHEIVGATASLARQWAASAALGHHDGALSYSADLFGRGKRWQLNARSLAYDDGFFTERSSESTRHELRYEHWVTPRVSLGVFGQSESRAGDDDDFLLPGFAWRFGERSNLRVWGDTDGDYRFDLRTYHRERDRFEFVHDGSGTRAEYRYFAGEKLELVGRYEDVDGYDDPILELGAQYYPRQYDDRALLWVSGLASGGDLGYRVRWQTPVLPGLFSTLELRDEPTRTEFYDPGLQLRWTLTVDFSFAGGRPIPARNEFNNSRAGAIGGRLVLRDGGSAAAAGIRQVSVMVNGVPRNALVNGNHFFLENVLPGVYEVALGAEHLPMQLAPEQARYRVKVAPSATTRMDFQLRTEYGIFGRITSDSALPAAGLVVQVFDRDGALLSTTRTDAHGYYRLTGLPPDDYRLAVLHDGVNVGERRVAVADAFVFDVDFSVNGGLVDPGT